MKVVLLQNVKNVGQKGEVKDVSEGFAWNHLIPNKLAKPGTQQILKEVQKLSKDKEKHHSAVLEKIKEIFTSLSNQTFVYKQKATEQGALFAKFDEKDLLKDLHQKGYKGLELKNISLSVSPIKHTGTYTAVLKEKNLTSTYTIQIEKSQ